MELSDMERAYIGQALYRKLADKMGTKDPDNMRGEVDAQLVSWYEATGARTYDANLLGRKVGTVSVRVSKEVPATTRHVLAVADDGALRDWCNSNSNDVVDFVMGRAQEFCEWMVACTGELPDGVTVTEVDVPSQPKRVTGTSMRIDPEKVADVLRDKLPGSAPVVGLLEEGKE